jgi:hypothetical protein
MKNKVFSFTLLTIMVLSMASCASSRTSGYRGSKKGYGCPSTAHTPVNGTVVVKTNS